MTKISHPVAHELGLTIRKLDDTTQELATARAEIAVLNDEIIRLRQLVPPECREELPSPTSTNSQSRSIDSSVPRYAQPTQASGRRSARSKTQAQRPDTPSGTITLNMKPTFCWLDGSDCTGALFPNRYQYQDGSLVKLPTGYLRATKSSVAKRCPKIPKRTVESEVTSQETPPYESLSAWCNRADGISKDWNKAVQRTFPRDWSHWWLYSMNMSPRELSDAEYKDVMDLLALLPATRLEDNLLRQTPLKHMLIEDGQQAQLLIQGKELAQRCLWNLAEKNTPGENRWTGWHQVPLEWGVLSGLGSYDNGPGYSIRASQPQKIWGTIEKVITLRHTVSHYSRSNDLFPCSLARVDGHLENVQKLAIQCYDKQGALEARRFRDELRMAAQHTSEEILALGMLAALPFAGYPWKNHHENVLGRLLRETEDAERGRCNLDEHFPVAIGRVAEDWAWQNPRRTRMKYEPPVSLGACPRTPPKRRHSTSSCQCSADMADLVARVKADRDWQRRNCFETPYDVPEWLLETQGQASPKEPPRARRRLSYSG